MANFYNQWLDFWAESQEEKSKSKAVIHEFMQRIARERFLYLWYSHRGTNK